MRDNLMAIFTGVCLGCVIVLWVTKTDELTCPQLPIDNELIYVNDSTYHRIHVRIDTTLYYADKPKAIETTH
jgi:hypothetical protein